MWEVDGDKHVYLTYYVPLSGIERCDGLQERTVWKASK